MSSRLTLLDTLLHLAVRLTLYCSSLFSLMSTSVSSSVPASPDFSGPTESLLYNRYYHFEQRHPHRTALLVCSGTFGLFGAFAGVGQFIFTGAALGQASLRSALLGAVMGTFYGSSVEFFSRRVGITSPNISHSLSGALTFSLVGGSVGGGRGAIVGGVTGALVTPVVNALWRFATRPKPAQVIYTQSSVQKSESIKLPAWLPFHPTTEEELDKLKEAKVEALEQEKRNRIARREKLRANAAADSTSSVNNS
jgi:hypothetical protein